MDHEYYMNIALDEAKAAFSDNETPIGCVIALGGEIIGRGRNMVAAKRNSLYHAEIIAINGACGAIGDWRLSEAVLYVTIEPCPMCAGAIVMSRVGTVVFGARNPKAGCAGSIYNLLDDARFNHRVNLVAGVLAEECGSLMTEFFRNHLNK
ncbi:MAG: nucleoside deaminase [Defluviitaleaceae bacterium]|nr:nucleoside deaminase [Defluviitaleaceae bacterium]